MAKTVKLCFFMKFKKNLTARSDDKKAKRQPINKIRYSEEEKCRPDFRRS